MRATSFQSRPKEEIPVLTQSGHTVKIPGINLYNVDSVLYLLFRYPTLVPEKEGDNAKCK